MNDLLCKSFIMSDELLFLFNLLIYCLFYMYLVVTYIELLVLNCYCMADTFSSLFPLNFLFFYDYLGSM